MRGKIPRFETLLRKEILHLFNINEDAFHHAENTVKQFLKLFQQYIEQLPHIKTNLKWSSSLRQQSAEICEILNISCQAAADRVDHPWLLTNDDTATINLTLLLA